MAYADWVGTVGAAVAVAGFARVVVLERRVKAGFTELRLEGVETAGPMPAAMPGFVEDGDSALEIIRVYSDHQGSVIWDFPATMNGGDNRHWVVRWRSLSVPVRVGLSAYDYPHIHDPAPGDERPVDWVDSGRSGVVDGPSHTQPVFVLAGPDGELTDVAVEIQWWRAAP
jgi:hypothetical protein